MRHIEFKDLEVQLSATPTSQVEQLRDYSDEQSRWHQGYRDLLDRVIRRRKAAQKQATKQ